MTKKPRRSLMDVMKERRYAEGCVLCDLPEELRNEVEQGKRDGAAPVSYTHLRAHET